MEHYNFKNGVQITPERIIEWMKQLLEKYDKKEYGFLGSISSGNTYIEANKDADDKNVEFIIAKNRTEIILNEKDIKNNNWQNDVLKLLNKEK